MSDWTDFGLRNMAPLSARTRAQALRPLLQDLANEAIAAAAEPLVGITADGRVRSGLFTDRTTSDSTSRITDAADALLAALDESERSRAVLPLDSQDRRLWFNIHPNVFRHGLLLEDLSRAKRDAALEVMRATLSERGFQQARDIMRLNGLLVEITNSPDEFGEWPYWFSLFGRPSRDQPWGWQIDGHHLNVNCTVIGDRLVLTPTFMGSEPCHVRQGALAGTEVLVAEERAGLDLVRSLDDDQLARAVLRESIHPDDLPPELQHPVDGRMVAGAFKDNATIDYEGVQADSLSDPQRRLLRNVIGSFVGWGVDDHATVRMDEVDGHLDETHFAWMGSPEEGPFYYRVQSPVVLIEFDHHPGIVFDNLVPSRNHIHTILRTPNGGDYGLDLLRVHHERFDHTGGRHTPRSSG